MAYGVAGQLIGLSIQSLLTFKVQISEGYHFRGEVFKESDNMVCYACQAVFTRVCTTMMKMLVTRLVLSQTILGGCKEIPQLGHF